MIRALLIIPLFLALGCGKDTLKNPDAPRISCSTQYGALSIKVSGIKWFYMDCLFTDSSGQTYQGCTNSINSKNYAIDFSGTSPKVTVTAGPFTQAFDITSDECQESARSGQ